MSSFKKNIPNLLSLSRIFPFTLLLVYVITLGDKWLFSLVAVFASLTDWLDGYLARRWQVVSQLGIILDPIADKVIIGAGVIALYVLAYVPLWLLLTIIVKDFFILLGGLLLTYKYTIEIPPSNWSGKSATVIITITLFLHFYFSSDDLLVFQLMTVLSVVVVIFNYSQRFFILKNHLSGV